MSQNSSDLPNQTAGNVIGAFLLTIPILGWFASAFILIMLASRVNTLSRRQSRDWLILMAMVVGYLCVLFYTMNSKDVDFNTGLGQLMLAQSVILFVGFQMLSKSFKVWSRSGA